MSTLALDIGGTFIKYALISNDFKILKKFRLPTEAAKGGDALIEKIIHLAQTFEAPFDRIAISTAGQVDSATGTVVYATDTIPQYTGIKIKALLEDATGLPVYAENDVNCAAVGEAVFGAAKGVSDFICLTYGTGIGGALWLHDALYKGAGCSAGELGHLITHAGGRCCTCGGEGCYEAYASAQALLKAAERTAGVSLEGQALFEPEHLNNPALRAVVDKWIDEVVLGLINIIYMFNPPLLVLGGGIMQQDYIIDLIDRKIYPHLMENYKNVKIVRAALGNDAALLGAAYLADAAFSCSLPQA